MLISLAVIVGGFLYFHRSHKTTPQEPQTPAKTSTPINSVDYSPPTADQKNATDTTKQQSSETPNTSASERGVTITVSRLNQPSAGQPVSLRTVLSGSVTGQCVATFSLSGQQTIIKTVMIASGPTFYSCEPIDVSTSEFSSSGNWSMSIHVIKNDAVVSNDATSSVEVKK